MVGLSEAQRRLVHGALVEAHGEEVGDLMIAQVAVDWSDLATKGDLTHHREMANATLNHHRAVLEARIDAALGKQTRMFVARNGALLVGVGGMLAGLAQMLS